MNVKIPKIIPGQYLDAEIGSILNEAIPRKKCNELADKHGFTHPMVNYLFNGKRKITENNESFLHEIIVAAKDVSRDTSQRAHRNYIKLSSLIELVPDETTILAQDGKY